MFPLLYFPLLAYGRTYLEAFMYLSAQRVLKPKNSSVKPWRYVLLGLDNVIVAGRRKRRVRYPYSVDRWEAILQ